MKKLFLLFTALFVLSPLIFSTIRGVPGNYANIQPAIDACVNGDTVLVEPGTYYANINFRGKNIVVTSRYYITNDPAAIYATIINGSTPVHQDTASCVIISSGEDSSAVLQGFTITGGGGTRWNDEHALGNYYREGGGILIQYSFPVIRDNIIRDNNITNNSNVVSTGGGAIRMGDSYPRIYNNIIMKNSAKYGAGIVLNYAGAEIHNNIICLNFGSTSYGSGTAIWMVGSFDRPKSVINNTIVFNSASSGTAGILSFGATVKNNIIWGNSTAAQIQGSVSAAYNDIQGGFGGAGNINADPLFNDSSYVLQNISPCIDKGDSGIMYNDSADGGNPLLAKYPSRGGLRNDMGAYGGPFAKVLTNSIIGIEPVSTELPWVFRLEQNYPNPFNPSTTINFSIPKQSFITLKIYDITGREVSVLVNNDLKPGVYKIDFYAAGFASGVYFYKLQAADFVITKKMILTR